MSGGKDDEALERADQSTLFGGTLDDLTVARREWKGMPEFVQEDLEPWKSVVVHFANRNDMDEFADLVDQTLTYRTQSVWYPAAEVGRLVTKRYADDEDPPA